MGLVITVLAISDDLFLLLLVSSMRVSSIVVGLC